MNPIRAAIIALLAFLATACATGAGNLQLSVTVADVGAESVVVSHESQANGVSPDDPVLVVRSDPSGSRVMLDSRYVGRTPVVVDDVSPGEYTVTVSAAGYRPFRHVVRLRAGSNSTIDVTLRRITGYLAIAPFEGAAEYSVAGSAVTEPIVELPLGTYVFRARKFGYRDFTRVIGVDDGVVTQVSPVFEPAPLAVTSFRVSRRVLNPGNPGLTGTLGVSFGVTAAGTADVEIRDGTGATIWSTNVPRFTTWEQATSWRGTDDTGAPVPDGQYTVILTVRDDDTVLSRTTSFDIDRSAVIALRSLWSLGPGTLYAPTTDTLPRYGAHMSFSVGRRDRSALTSASVPVTVATRFGLGRGIELGLLGRIEAGEDDGSDRYGVSGYGSFAFFDARASLGVSAAAIIAGGFQSAPFSGPDAPDRYSSVFGVSALVPVQFGIGPFRITAGPEIAIEPYDRVAGPPAVMPGVQQTVFSPTFLARFRAGVLLDFGQAVIAASTAVPVPLPGDSTPARTIHSGAELHWLIPGTYLIVSGLVFTTFVPFEAVSWGAGAGFGVMF